MGGTIADAEGAIGTAVRQRDRWDDERENTIRQCCPNLVDNVLARIIVQVCSEGIIPAYDIIRADSTVSLSELKRAYEIAKYTIIGRVADNLRRKEAAEKRKQELDSRRGKK